MILSDLILQLTFVSMIVKSVNVANTTSIILKHLTLLFPLPVRTLVEYFQFVKAAFKYWYVRWKAICTLLSMSSSSHDVFIDNKFDLLKYYTCLLECNQARKHDVWRFYRTAKSMAPLVCIVKNDFETRGLKWQKLYIKIKSSYRFTQQDIYYQEL